MENSTLDKEVDIKREINKGRWYVKEMIGVIQLKKYRSMKERYFDIDKEGYFDNISLTNNPHSKDDNK